MSNVILTRSLDDELTSVPPGPKLAARLADIDRSALAGADLVALARARLRQLSHDEGQLSADLVELAHSSDETGRVAEIPPFAETEIACGLTWTVTQAGRELTFATSMIGRLPAVHAALLTGAIDRSKAWVFNDVTAIVEDVSVARQVADEVLPLAPGLNAREIGRKLRRAILKLDPAAAARRAARSRRRRRVESGQDREGTAFISALGLPVQQAAVAMDRVDGLAHAARQSGDSRTLEQLRADVVVGLLDGTWDGPPSARRAGAVELTVPLTTLMGLQDLPGDLAGWGPVCADIARQATAQAAADGAKMRFAVHDKGAVVAHGSTKRRPPAAMAAAVRAHTDRCIAPGCLRPARACDLDHRDRWVDSRDTSAGNLAPLCRRHHRAKDEGGWRYRRIDDHTYLWTSPLGRSYAVDRRRFPDREHG